MADQAQVFEQQHRERAIARVRNSISDVYGKSRLICTDCGEHIPRARIVAHPMATRCIGCQTIEEMHGMAR